MVGRGKGGGYHPHRKQQNFYQQPNRYQPFGGFGGGFPMSVQVNPEEETKMEEENRESSILDSRNKISLIKDPLNAFHLFKMDNFDHVRKNNPLLTLMEVSDVLAQDWENTDHFTRTKYQKIYEEIQDRKNNPEKYEKKKEMPKPDIQSLIPGGSITQAIQQSSGNNLGSKSQDKPLPPKRALTAFFIYKMDKYESVKQENPEAKVTAITVMIAESWKNLDSETRAIYEKKHQEAVEKYQQELREYEEKYGKIEKKSRMKRVSQDSEEDD